MKKLMLLSGVAVLVLAGCGKSSEAIDEFSLVQDAVQEEQQNQNSDEATEESESQEEGAKLNAEGVPEHYKSELKVDDELTIIINADVDSLGYNDMKIYQVEKRKIDGQYLENLAKRLFDNGEFTNAKPYRMWSESELLSEQNRLKEMEENAINGNNISRLRLEEIDDFINQKADKAESQPVDGDPYIYESAFTNVSSGEFTRCQVEYSARLRGKINGKEFELCYEQHNGANQEQQTKLWLSPLFPYYEEINKGFTFMAATKEATIGHEKSSDYSKRVYKLVEESTISLEGLEAQAEQFLVDGGFPDYVLIATNARFAYDENGDEKELCGYDFYYEPKAINRSTDGNKDVSIETHGAPTERYIRVSVCEDGIMGVEFNDDYEIKDVIAEKTSLLSLDQIVESATEAIEDNIEALEKSGIIMMLTDEALGGDLNSIQLGYQVCEYDNKLVYMPVWKFGMDFEIIGEMDAFEVNAVDGTFQEAGKGNYWCDRALDY